MTLTKKIEMITYINHRDRRIKFQKSDERCTSLLARKKAKQLLWKIKSKYLPILQNTSYCYSFVWSSGKIFEYKKYYVVDIYDNITYARVLDNPSDIYALPQYKDKVPYTKLYVNINRIVRDFLKIKQTED